MENKEVYIDVLDLLRRILKKWKFVVALALICAIVFGGLSYCKSIRNSQSASQPASDFSAFQQQYGLDKPYYFPSVLSLAEGLIPQDNPQDASLLYQVEAAVEAYNSYNEQIDLIRSHLGSSMLYSLPMAAVPTLSRQYVILPQASECADSSFTAIASNIRDAFISRLSSDASYQRVIDSLNLPVTVNDFKDLISFDGPKSGITLSLTEKTLIEVESTQPGNSFSIIVTAPTQAEAFSISNEFDKLVAVSSKDISASFADIPFSVTLVAEQYAAPRGTAILKQKSDEYTQLSSIFTSQADLTKNFSDGQKALFNKILSVQSAAASAESEVSEAFVIVTRPALPLKQITIGIFAGLFIACAWIAVGYFFSRRIRIPEDILAYPGFSILSTLKVPASSDDLEKVCEDISAIAQKKGYSELLLTGASGGAMEAVRSTICEKLSQSGISTVALAYDTPSFSKVMASAEAVVAVEQIDYTEYAQVDAFSRFAQCLKANVLGTVVLR